MVRRLAVRLLAFTVTTALAFMTMALLPDRAGDFVDAIAVALIIMLVASFAPSLMIEAAGRRPAVRACGHYLRRMGCLAAS